MMAAMDPFPIEWRERQGSLDEQNVQAL